LNRIGAVRSNGEVHIRIKELREAGLRHLLRRQVGEGHTAAVPAGDGVAGVDLLLAVVVAGCAGKGSGHGAAGMGGGGSAVRSMDAQVQVEGGPPGRPRRRHHRRRHARAPGTPLITRDFVLLR
jgi:hypothetical protein